MTAKTTKVITDFGKINGRRVVSFDVSDDGMVLPSRYRGMETELHNELDKRLWITARESFRRWKIARKAWKTRKFKNQLTLAI